uniref:Bestrophin homolog n=1 Tax=Heterorhabditis bacteriophora TaxID=37862 RepID=A0A1I7X5Y3_HETBA
MTVTYTLEVSRAKFWGFPKLLARWRGSIYRLMYREMICFLCAYYLIMLLYRQFLNDHLKSSFELLAVYCREFTSVVPITFVMGFYVSFVVGRWWQQYMSIPWPDRLCIQVSAYVQGTDERSRLIRRALARYLNLMAILTFQNTSTVIKRRFPTTAHLVDAGILTQEEKEDMESTETQHGVWLVDNIMDCMEFRSQCGMVWSYDWISVPLVYTQDASSISGHVIDYYLPVFTIFQFFFYVGWLKVAESMICPFGEDEDDFDLNCELGIIDRNLQVSLLIVDAMHKKYPSLSRDLFWGSAEAELPYTQAAAKFKCEPFVGSTSAMNIPYHEAEWEVEQMPPITEEDDSRVKGMRDIIEGEEDADEESLGSRGFEKGHQRGLGALLLGFSRQTLSSRFGSRKSLNSCTGKSVACAVRSSSATGKRSLIDRHLIRVLSTGKMNNSESNGEYCDSAFSVNGMSSLNEVDKSGVSSANLADRVSDIAEFVYRTRHLLAEQGSSAFQFVGDSIMKPSQLYLISYNVVMVFGYTFFIVLYPLGVTGELLTLTSSLPEVAEKKYFTFEMPNAVNMGISFWWILVVSALFYIPGLLTLHMIYTVLVLYLKHATPYSSYRISPIISPHVCSKKKGSQH